MGPKGSTDLKSRDWDAPLRNSLWEERLHLLPSEAPKRPKGVDKRLQERDEEMMGFGEQVSLQKDSIKRHVIVKERKRSLLTCTCPLRLVYCH